MRVCLVTGEYPPDHGGVADYTHCLAEALATRGLVVDVLTRRREGAERRRARSPRGGNGARAVSRRGRSREEMRTTVFRVDRVWGWSLSLGLQRMAALTRPDVLHIQYQTAAYRMSPGVNVAPWYLRRRIRAKLAVTYHDLAVPYLFPKAGRLRRAITMLPARSSHLTVATNREDYDELAAYGRPWQLELVPIGSNLRDSPLAGFEIATWRQEHGVRPDVGLVAYFGMLNSSKGARTLVEALSALREKGRAVELVMVGAQVGASDPTNMAYLKQVEADIAAAGLQEVVRWTGHLPPEEVSAWLNAADAVALPYVDGASFRRGSLLAALTHSRPVVTTIPRGRPKTSQPGSDRPQGDAAGREQSRRASAPDPSAGRDVELPSSSEAGFAAPLSVLPELVDGESALLVPPSEPLALARAIEDVLANPALAEQLSLGAREVAAHFSWERIAARHEELYRQITGEAS